MFMVYLPCITYYDISWYTIIYHGIFFNPETMVICAISWKYYDTIAKWDHAMVYLAKFICDENFGWGLFMLNSPNIG